MVDFHTHILPGIDDGSSNVDMTFAMLEQMREQGVRNLIATPHFYANNYTIDQFLDKRIDSYQKVVLQAKRRGISLPNIRLGAEVLYFSGIGRANLLNKLCIENTNVLLLEMPFCQWEPKLYQELEEIICDQKIKIVLAHIERYFSYQKDLEMWEKIMKLPLYKQMNAAAFTSWRFRRKSLQILENQGVVLLGSDCHDDSHRPPNLLDGLSIIVGKEGDDYLKKLGELEEKLLEKW